MIKNILVILFIILLIYNSYSQEDSTKIKSTGFSIFPALGFAPETGFIFGVIGFYVSKKKLVANNEFYRPTSITPFIVYTTKKQFLLKTDADIFLKNGININGTFRYSNFPDKFFGIENNVDPNIFEKYTNQFARFNGRIMKPLNKNLYIGLLYDLQINSINVDVSTGKLTNNISGASGGRSIGIGSSLILDTRNSTLYPTAGDFLNTGIVTFSKYLGSEFSYTSFLLDYRKYFEFLGPKNILALQFRANLNIGKNIPFYKLSKLGGNERLRGIKHRNLYISRQSIYFQMEARQELFWRLGGVLFAGIGKIFDSFSKFKTDNIRFVYGLGGRIQALKDEKLNIRIDLGFTDNGQNALYLSVREAF